MDQFHSDDFLLYAYLQSGQDAAAKAIIVDATAAANHFETMPNMADHYMTGMFPYYRTKLPIIYNLELRDWKAAAALQAVAGAPPETQTLTYWARTVAAGHLHQVQQAQANLVDYDALIARINGNLPADKQQQLIATRSFQAGLQTLRQVEFALLDFRIHTEYSPQAGGRVMEILREVRAEVAVVPVPDWNRFPMSFGHIFAGGYAAGYYSYKWAEVLAADAFAAFEESGVFDRATAQRFLDAILSRGGSRDALDAFIEFRGRRPDVRALLKQHGILGGARRSA